MHWTYPGPQDLSQVTGGWTGVQIRVCRSKSPDLAIKDVRCPLRVAAAEAVLARIKMKDKCIASAGSKGNESEAIYW